MSYDVRANLVIIACISIYSLAAILFPFDSDAGVFYGFVVLFILITTYALSVIFGLSFFSRFGELGYVNLRRYPSSYVYWVPIFLGFLGLVFIVVDRVMFRGINPFLVSPAEARNIMSQGDGGVSSVFSLAGNIFQCFCIVPAYYMISRSEYRFWVFVFSFSIATLSSYLLGGRTPILCFVVISFATWIYFSRYSMSLKSSFYSLVGILSLGFFGVYVFVLRAELSGLDSYSYATKLIVHLGFSKDFSAFSEPSGIGDYWNFLLLVIGYLVHPFFVSSDAVLNGSGAGNASFYAVLFLLSKFLPIDLSGFKHDYYELFLSLPGGLYYDFGVLGLLLGGFFLAAIYLFGAIVASFLKGRADFPFILILFVISTLLLSPLLSSINFVFFNFYIFILFSYFFLIFTLKIGFGNSK